MANEFEKLEEYNTVVKSIGRNALSSLKGNVSSLFTKGTGALNRSLKVNFKKSLGKIDYISFTLARHGIYAELGVGRGVSIKTIESNASQVGRKPKPWIRQPVDKAHQEIAAKVTELWADETVRAVNLPKSSKEA